MQLRSSGLPPLRDAALITRPKLDVILSSMGSHRLDPIWTWRCCCPRRARAPSRLRRALPSSRWSARWSDVRWVSKPSGLMSHGEIEARLDAALADPLQVGILLDLRSPGGEASGVFELARRIRVASTIKPIGRTPTMPRTRRLLPSRLSPAPDAIADRRVGSIGGSRCTSTTVGEGRQWPELPPLSSRAVQERFLPARATSTPRATTAFADQGGSSQRHLRESGRTRCAESIRMPCATEAGLFYAEQAVATASPTP